jgi:hypothetical protein
MPLVRRRRPPLRANAWASSGKLHAQAILSGDEFATQKATILNTI